MMMKKRNYLKYHDFLIFPLLCYPQRIMAACCISKLMTQILHLRCCNCSGLATLSYSSSPSRQAYKSNYFNEYHRKFQTVETNNYIGIYPQYIVLSLCTWQHSPMMARVTERPRLQVNNITRLKSSIRSMVVVVVMVMFLVSRRMVMVVKAFLWD